MRYVQAGSAEDFDLACSGMDRDDVIDRIATYMDQSVVVSRTRTMFEHPSLEGPQPVGNASDGEWVWSLIRAKLLRVGAFIPEPDFVTHVLSRDLPPQELSTETIELAVDTASRANRTT